MTTLMDIEEIVDNFFVNVMNDLYHFIHSME